MRVLNLYAGVGGNRKLWTDVNVVAVESNPQIAEVYQRLYPDDVVCVGDAHQFLLDNFDKHDLIWSSPPCQSHSVMVKATRHDIRKFPDMKLYEEIIFLQHFHKGLWVVENVKPYYEPLIPPTAIIGRHYFWSNFAIYAEDVERPKGFIRTGGKDGKIALQDWLGIHFDEDIYYGKNHDQAQILRNCVHPELGKQIFDNAKGPYAAIGAERRRKQLELAV